MNVAAPIFVGGLDHSGKATLRVALGAHPDIHMVRRIDLWTRLRGLHAAGARGQREVVERLTTRGAAAHDLDRDRLQRVVADPDFGALVREIGRQLCERAGTSRWGLQEALLELETERILAYLPDARVVCLVRDPRDRYAAMRRDGAVGRGGVAAETAAWVASARAAAAAATAWPKAFRVVRYEALVADPETVLGEVCAFIGERAVSGLGARGSEPPGAVERAAPVTSNADLAFIGGHAAAELQALGYPTAPAAPPTATLSDRLVDAARWQLGRMAWRWRSRHLRPARTPGSG